MFIDPKRVMTMPKFIQHTPHRPDTESQHHAAKKKLEKARQEEETARIAHEKNQKQKKVTE